MYKVGAVKEQAPNAFSCIYIRIHAITYYLSFTQLFCVLLCFAAFCDVLRCCFFYFSRYYRLLDYLKLVYMTGCVSLSLDIGIAQRRLLLAAVME